MQINAKAGIPPRMAKYTLANFPVLMPVVKSWLENPVNWCLYLWGETGGRKSTLAAATLMSWREMLQCQSGAFLPAYRLVEEIRDIENVQAKGNIKRWKNMPMLVIDDLGKHRDTPHVIESILHLLHYRYDWCAVDGKARKTIITANMSLDELAEKIDPATARRIEEGTVLKMEI